MPLEDKGFVEDELLATDVMSEWEKRRRVGVMESPESKPLRSAFDANEDPVQGGFCCH